jgi:hypothetical protein
MMGNRQKLDGDGWDAFSRYSRRILKWKAGQVAKIKRRFARKARLDAKREITAAVNSVGTPPSNASKIDQRDPG